MILDSFQGSGRKKGREKHGKQDCLLCGSGLSGSRQGPGFLRPAWEVGTGLISVSFL